MYHDTSLVRCASFEIVIRSFDGVYSFLVSFYNQKMNDDLLAPLYAPGRAG